MPSHQHHMTAEDIYRQLLEHGDEIGLATVYRVLTQFEAAGLVLKHNFEGGQAVYELDRGGHHDHMVDVDTGKIIEFESHEIEELQRKIADRTRLRARRALAGAVRAQEASVMARWPVVRPPPTRTALHRTPGPGPGFLRFSARWR